jgi:protein-S-isoprenylcysteine O-methyltransferase Ste14
MIVRNLSNAQKGLLSVVIPLVYLAPLAGLWFLPKQFGFGHRPVVFTGLAIGISGLALWLASMAHLGKSLAVLPTADELVTHGVYRWLRHPIYRGIELTLCGVALICGSWPGIVYVLAVVLPLNIMRGRWEEYALLERFGDRYRAYRDQTWF